MKKEIGDLVETEQESNMMWEQWLKEVKNKESQAILLWSRNEKFLRKKKHEDEQNSCATVTETTWEEKLQLNRKIIIVVSWTQDPRNFTMYTHLPLPQQHLPLPQQSDIRDYNTPLYPYKSNSKNKKVIYLIQDPHNGD